MTGLVILRTQQPIHRSADAGSSSPCSSAAFGMPRQPGSISSSAEPSRSRQATATWSESGCACNSSARNGRPSEESAPRLPAPCAAPNTPEKRLGCRARPAPPRVGPIRERSQSAIERVEDFRTLVQDRKVIRNGAGTVPARDPLAHGGEGSNGDPACRIELASTRALYWSHFLRKTGAHPGSSPGQAFSGKCSKE
jgi:hypothetical protein